MHQASAIRVKVNINMRLVSLSLLTGTRKVGYPIASPNTENAASVAGFYRLVKVDSEDFFDNVLSARYVSDGSTGSNVELKFYFRINGQIKKWYQLGKQRDKESWEMFPTTVNAYFNPPANEVCLPRENLTAA